MPYYDTKFGIKRDIITLIKNESSEVFGLSFGLSSGNSKKTRKKLNSFREIIMQNKLIVAAKN